MVEDTQCWMQAYLGWESKVALSLTVRISREGTIEPFYFLNPTSYKDLGGCETQEAESRITCVVSCTNATIALTEFARYSVLRCGQGGKAPMEV